jgi:hypothetical protein
VQRPFWQVRPEQHSVLEPHATFCVLQIVPQKPLAHKPEQQSLFAVHCVPSVLQAGGGTAQAPFTQERPEQHSPLEVQAVPELLQSAVQRLLLHQ